MAVIGWVGAALFLVLFLIHPSTKNNRRTSGVARVFWMYIIADSAVMLLLYTSGLIGILAPEWEWRPILRVFIAVVALLVVWWRVALFVSLNMRKEPEPEPVEDVS